MKAIRNTLLVVLVLVIGYVVAVRFNVGSVFANSEPGTVIQNLLQADNVEPTATVAPTATPFGTYSLPGVDAQQQQWLEALPLGESDFVGTDGSHYQVFRYSKETFEFVKLKWGWEPSKTLIPLLDKDGNQVMKKDADGNPSQDPEMVWYRTGWFYDFKYESAQAFFNDFADFSYAIPSAVFKLSDLTIRGFDSIPTPTPAP